MSCRYGAADVGIGIAARGSAAARNAADLVLTDDDLTVLLEAVNEGRALWRSVTDAISILLGGNAGEVGFTVLGTLLSGASRCPPASCSWSTYLQTCSRPWPSR